MKVKVILIVVSCMLLFAGCTKDSSTNTEQQSSGNQVTQAPTQAPAKGEGIAVGEPAPGSGTDNTQAKIDINIAVLKGPTAIGMVKLMEDSAGNTAKNNYKFTVAGTADEISAGLLKGEYDIAAVPCNLASVLYNKTEGKIKIAGINTLGVLYIVETGDAIKSVEDLKGKTIYTTGLGTTPQYTLNYLLTSHGIDPEKDVKIEYKTEATEVAAMLETATDAIAMLPQPYVTTVMLTNNNVKIALDVAAEWDKIDDGKASVVTGVVVVRSDFLENNKAAFDAFMEEYKASTDFVNGNADQASALVEKYGIFKAAPTKKALPFCNITLIQGNEMKDKVNGYLSVLFDQNPASVGGKLPDDGFYYMP